MGSQGRQPPSPETTKRLAEVRAKYPAGPFLRAIDLATGRKVWDYRMGSGRSTGVLATAGNVLFIGGQGGIVALNAKTGENLWHVDVGQSRCDGACFAASAMTYMVGGKQYIAMSGYGALIAYTLDGKPGNMTAAGAISQTFASKPEDLAELPDALGKEVTVRVCTACHGAGNWSRLRLSQTAWDDTLKRMKPRGMALSVDEYKTVLDYLSTHLASKP